MSELLPSGEREGYGACDDAGYAAAAYIDT